MGTVNFQLLNKELLLEEQSDRFVSNMVLSPNRYDYALMGSDKNLLAYNQVSTVSDTEKEFNVGFLLQNLNSDKMTKLNDLKEKVHHTFPYFSLVPVKLFDKTKPKHYIGQEEIHTFYDKIKVHKEELMLVHGVPERLYEGLARKHKDVQYRHVINAMLKELSSSKQDDICSVFIVDRMAYVAVQKSKRFLGVNYYECHNLNDLLYYITLNFENYKLDRKKTSLKLHGYFEKDSALVKLISTYYSNIEMGSPDSQFSEKTGVEMMARLFQYVA